MGNNGSNMRTKVCRAPNGDLYCTRQRERSHRDRNSVCVVIDGRKRKVYTDDDGTIWVREGKCWYSYEHRERSGRVRDRVQSLYVEDARSTSSDSYARSSYTRSSSERSSSVEPRGRSYYVETVSQSCYSDGLGRPCSSDGCSRGSFERVRTPPAETYRRSLYAGPSSDSYTRRFDDDSVSVRIINVEP